MVSRFLFGFAASLLLTNCTVRQLPAYGAAPGPAAFNETVIDAKVLAATIVDSTTLNILPQQPIVVLRLQVVSVKKDGEMSFLKAQTGEVFSAYSKDLSAADLAGKNASATITFRGDERGGSFWAQEISPQNSP